MDEIRQYMGEKPKTSVDQRDQAFRNLAGKFGPVDSRTLIFRSACKERGFKVVFRSGLSRDQTLKVLRATETQQYLAKS